MQKHTVIYGTIAVSEQPRQRQLHAQIGEFHGEMKRPKDHSEIRKDKRQSAPKDLLPMVF